MNNISFCAAGSCSAAVSTFVEGEPAQRRRHGLDVVRAAVDVGHPGPRSISPILSIHLAGASSILAHQLHHNHLNMRAPGMTLHKMRCSCGRSW